MAPRARSTIGSTPSAARSGSRPSRSPRVRQPAAQPGLRASALRRGKPPPDVTARGARAVAAIGVRREPRQRRRVVARRLRRRLVVAGQAEPARGRRGWRPRCRAARARRRRPRSAGARVRRAGAPRATPRPPRRRCRGAAGPTASAPAGRLRDPLGSTAGMIRGELVPFTRVISSSIVPTAMDKASVARARSRLAAAHRARPPGLRSGVVNCAAYEHGVAGRRRRGRRRPRGADRRPDRFVWIGMYEPSEDLLREVQREFDLHDLAVEDAHNAHQRPEVRGLRRLAVRRPAHRADERRRRPHIQFGETHVFVGKNYVVSVRHGSLLSHVGLRSRCEATPQLLAQGRRASSSTR